MKKLILLLASALALSAQPPPPLATQAQAEAGTSNFPYMSPLRVAQAITAQGGGGGNIPGGSGTQIQYRLGPVSFGGIAGTSWNGSALVLPTLTLSTLTSGRIPIAGTAGLLGDSANLTYSSGIFTVNGTLFDATGAITIGSGGTVGGYAAFGQGTATTAPTASVGYMAPTSVPTKYMIIFPGAPTTGFVLRTGASDPQTETTVAGLGTGAVVRASETVHSISFTVTGNGSAITTGVKDLILSSPYGGTCTGWTITTSAADTITFDILRAANGAGAPSSSIVGAGTKPAQTTGVSTNSTTFTSWTSTAITANDTFKVQITAVGGVCTVATITLYFQ